MTNPNHDFSGVEIKSPFQNIAKRDLSTKDEDDAVDYRPFEILSTRSDVMPADFPLDPEGELEAKEADADPKLSDAPSPVDSSNQTNGFDLR
jgi:hypothetical protein